MLTENSATNTKTENAYNETVPYPDNDINYSMIDNVITSHLSLSGFTAYNKFDELLYCLKIQEDFPSFQSISKCFSDWGIPNQIQQIKEEQFRLLNNYFFLTTLQWPERCILVVKADDLGVTYLSSVGEFTRIGYGDFFKLWNGYILTIQTIPNEEMKLVRNPADKYSIEEKLGDRESIKSEIARLSSKKSPVLIINLFRLISYHFTYIFFRLGIKPTTLTFLWLLCLLGASALLADNLSLTNRLIAAGLIIFHYILDCSDGELARFTKQESSYGHTTEHIVHYTSMFCLIVGITIGLYKETNNPNILFTGLICLLFDTLFHTTLYLTQLWYNPSLQYKILDKIRPILNKVLPINPNLFLVCILLNCLYFSLIFWSILAFILFITMTLAYLIPEYKLFKRNSALRSHYIK
ncbi:Phosphatidylglycerophosphate synthase [Chitinophaga sp. CF118]|uniref:CDP-alcohol phosphatidyltransferase family protein n=1 Tax=Chitinophaga sp. CF118 TaxID=1884367 RepID=UPI0008DF5EBB|nr:CDP-alcohol phosphatidyltransferase family protein [Chitinophaga sp. CF118]SFD01234.1 Phosphatidylglycerophosphate synthase [Chitinophaga sp. CF118]